MDKVATAGLISPHLTLERPGDVSTTKGDDPMLGDVAGIGALKGSMEEMKGSLAHTNELLAAVLVELQQLNQERMATMVEELHEVNEQLGRVVAQPVA